TNDQVQQAADVMAALRKDGVLTGAPFTAPIDFLYFDLCPYDGRTSKHGAFMGGADFVQWHGNYPMLARTVELRAQADELRRAHGRRGPKREPSRRAIGCTTTSSGSRSSSCSTSAGSSPTSF